MKLRIA